MTSFAFIWRIKIQKGVRAGLGADEAKRIARLQSGGLAQIKEACRNAGGISAVGTKVQDLGYAARILRKSPTFAVIALLLLNAGM